jgi:chaperonin GroES
MEKIRPLHEWAVIQPDPLAKEEVSKGGLILPKVGKNKRRRATVMAVGPGKLLELGKRVEPEIKAGDRVVYMEHNVLQGALDVDDERGLCLIPIGEIIGVIEDEAR